MRYLKLFLSLAILAGPLAFAHHLHAQTVNDDNALQVPYAATGPAKTWDGQCPERQQIREERQRISADHEELEAERDRLRGQCMDSKGQERAACHENFQALRAREDELHQRMKALHEKSEADPGCHRDHHEEHHEGEAANQAWPSRDAQPTTH